MQDSRQFGDYLVFVDESGDHNLSRIDPQFPVFVLLFAIFRKDDYVREVCPKLQQFKLEFWGHEEVVLHEHDIRKPHGSFLFLHWQPVRERFLTALARQIEELPVTTIAVIIDKPAFAKRYHDPVSPYDYAMETGLERVFRHLESLGQASASTPIIVETRGRREDAELELAFRRVCDGNNALQKPFPFDLVMVSKLANSAGLQLTDLMARPIAINHFRPGKPNRAFDIIATKFRRSPSGTIEGWGIKLIP